MKNMTAEQIVKSLKFCKNNMERIEANPQLYTIDKEEYKDLQRKVMCDLFAEAVRVGVEMEVYEQMQAI